MGKEIKSLYLTDFKVVFDKVSQAATDDNIEPTTNHHLRTIKHHIIKPIHILKLFSHAKTVADSHLHTQPKHKSSTGNPLMKAQSAASWLYQKVRHHLTCLGLSLTTSQINEVEFAGTDMLLSRFITVTHLHEDGKDGVAAAGVGVHKGGTHWSVLPAPVHDVVAVHDIMNRVHWQSWKRVAVVAFPSWTL